VLPCDKRLLRRLLASICSLFKYFSATKERIWILHTKSYLITERKSKWQGALISHPTCVLILLMLLVLLDIVRSIFLYFYWGWLSIHWARDRLMLQHVARASQTFWICAIYTNLHLLDNCTVIFYSASLHILKWRYQTFCFWLLIIYHPLKVPGFPISRFSPVPDDKHVHVVNHAAKNLSHRKQSCI